MKYVLVIVAVTVGGVLENMSTWFPGVAVAGAGCYFIGSYYARKENKER